MRGRYAASITIAALLIAVAAMIPVIAWANGGSGVAHYGATDVTRIGDKAELAGLARVLFPTSTLSEREALIRLGDCYRVADNPLVSRVLPGVQFLKRVSNVSPDGKTVTSGGLVYFEGLYQGRRYNLSAFNRLLLDCGIRMTDDNAIELAQVFALLALAERHGEGALRAGIAGITTAPLGFPAVTFLDGKVGKFRVYGDWYQVYLKLRVASGVEEEWYFGRGAVMPGQFSRIGVRPSPGASLSLRYYPYEVETSPGRGLDLNEDLKIDSLFGGIKIEHHGDTVEHYLVVASDGNPTDDSLRFIVSGFPIDSHNVFIRVKSIEAAYVGDFLFRRLAPGETSVVWIPPAAITGIGEVTAGYADTLSSHPESTYQEKTAIRRLTLEAVKRGGLWENEECNVYYCAQFFGPDSAQALSFVNLVIAAAQSAGSAFSQRFGFALPVDREDHCHDYYLNDGVNWFHLAPTTSAVHTQDTLSVAFSRRKLSLRISEQACLALRMSCPVESVYGNDLTACLRSGLLHEFYHQRQWDTSYMCVKDRQWDWFIEAQARFVESALYPQQELLRWRDYSYDAVLFFRGGQEFGVPVPSQLDQSVRTGTYYRCPFWRYLYEHHKPGGSPGDSLAVVWQAFAATRDVNANPVVDGRMALEYALDRVPGGRFANLDQALDSFAWACALTDSAYHVWYNPNDVYDSVLLSGTASISLVSSEIMIPDCVHHPFGLHYWSLALESVPPIESVEVALVRQQPEQTELHAQLILLGGEDWSLVQPLVLAPGDARDSAVLSVGSVRNAIVCVSRHDVNETDAPADFAIRVRPIGGLRPDSVLQRTNGETLYARAGVPVPFALSASFVNEGRSFISSTGRVEVRYDTSLCCSSERTVSGAPRASAIVLFDSLRTGLRGEFREACFLTDTGPGVSRDTVFSAFWIVDTASPPGRMHQAFEGGFTPPGWSVRHWMWYDACCWHAETASRWRPPQGSGQYACLRWHGDGNCEDELTSPIIDCRGCDSVLLIVKTYFNVRIDSFYEARIRVSTDGGASFNICARQYAGDFFGVETLNLTAWAQDQDRVRLKWFYAGDSTLIEAWCVDDVKVLGFPLPNHDVGVSQITYPPALAQLGASYRPTLLVRNYGCSRETVDVGVRIGAYVRGTEMIFDYGEHKVVVFDLWEPPSGFADTVRAWAHAGSDDFPLNDSARAAVRTVADTWVAMADMRHSCRHGTSLCGIPAAGDTMVLAVYRSSYDIFAFRPPGDSFQPAGVWTDLPGGSVLPTKGRPGVLIGWGGSDTCYYFPGGNKRYGYRRSALAGSGAWERIADVPDKVRYGAAVGFDRRDHLYLLAGSKRRFFRYSKPQNTWQALTSPPRAVRRGAALACSGGDYLYAFCGRGAGYPAHLYRYQISRDAWEQMSAPPFDPHKYACMIYGAEHLYARDGNGHFATYSIEQDAWSWGPLIDAWNAAGTALAYAAGNVYATWGKGDWRHMTFLRFTDSSTLAQGGLDRLLSAKADPPGAGFEPEYPPVSDSSPDPDMEGCFAPQYSPDGSWIVFFAIDTLGYYQLYKQPADSGEATALTSDTVNHEYPKWSNDGQWIAFCHDDRIAKIQSDGSSETDLTDNLGADPQWSPDDQWIAYSTWQGNHRIRIVSADGSEEVELTSAGNCFTPQWSPDGQWVIYSRLMDGANQLRRVNVATLVDEPVVQDEGRVELPRSSHDGEWLVFEKFDTAGFRQVAKCRPGGTELQVMTSGTYHHSYPSFSPSDTWLLYSRENDSTAQICKVHANGGNEITLTNDLSLKYVPEWSPDECYAVFEYDCTGADGGGKAGIGFVPTGGTGSFEEDDNSRARPPRFALHEPRPNPSRTKVRIAYDLPREQRMVLALYDAAGRLVAVLVADASARPGQYTRTWDHRDGRGARVSSGVYFCRLAGDQEVRTRRLVVTD